MDCIESSDTRSAVKCEENKKKYVLENTKKNHVILYTMDGGIIVTSSTPNLKASPEYVNLERMIRKEYQGNIKIVEKQFNEKDVEL